MRIMIRTVAIALAGCQPVPLMPGTPADPLTRELAGRVAGPAQSCISTQPNQNIRVINPATVAYEVGTTFWVNRLQQKCPSLSPHNTLIIERGGAQLCRGDRIRGLEPGATIPGPGCNLQDWVPYRSR